MMADIIVARRLYEMWRSCCGMRRPSLMSAFGNESRLFSAFSVRLSILTTRSPITLASVVVKSL